MSKKIKLGRQELYAIVDDEDFKRVSEYKWHNCNAGALNSSMGLLLHRFILNADDPKVFIYHINGDKLDNRKSNLRIAPNSRNRRVSKTGYIGVYKINGKTKTFGARITKYGVCQFLGAFKTPEEAAKAYNKAAVAMYGKNAVVNDL